MKLRRRGRSSSQAEARRKGETRSRRTRGGRPGRDRGDPPDRAQEEVWYRQISPIFEEAIPDDFAGLVPEPGNEGGAYEAPSVRVVLERHERAVPDDVVPGPGIGSEAHAAHRVPQDEGEWFGGTGTDAPSGAYPPAAETAAHPYAAVEETEAPVEPGVAYEAPPADLGAAPPFEPVPPGEAEPPAPQRPFVHDSGTSPAVDPPMIIPIRAYYLTRVDDTLRSIAAQFLNTPSRWQELRSINAAYPGIADAGPDTVLPVGSSLALPGDPLPWGRPDPVYLWTLAEKFLYAAWAREPTPEEVVPFWRGLTSGAEHLDMGAAAPEAIGAPAGAPLEPPVPPAVQPPGAPPEPEAAAPVPPEPPPPTEPAPAAEPPPEAPAATPPEETSAEVPAEAEPAPAGPPEAPVVESVEAPEVEEEAAREPGVSPQPVPPVVPPAVGEHVEAPEVEEEAAREPDVSPPLEPEPVQEAPPDEPEALEPAADEAPEASPPPAPEAVHPPPEPPAEPPRPEAPSYEAPPPAEAPSHEPPPAPVPAFEPPPGMPDLGPIEPEVPRHAETETPTLPAFMPSLTGATPSAELPAEEVMASTQRALAGTAIGDAMMLWQLGRLRRRRGARRGDTTPDPLELSLEQTARMDSLRLIEAAMRHLRAVTIAQLRPRPRVVCVRTGAYGFEVLLEQPVEAPEGWQVASGGYVLELPRSVTVEQLDAVGQGPSLCPALVPVGDTAEGPLLLNIEEIGCLAVSGPNNPTAGLLTSIVETLGSSPLAGDIRIITVGVSSPTGPGWERIHATSFDSPQLEHLLSTAHSPDHAAAGSIDVLVVGPGNDLLFQRSGQIATTPGSRLMLVGATSSAAARWPWRIHIDENCRAVVHPIAVNIIATQAMRPDLAYLLSEAAEGPQSTSRF